MEIRWLQVPSFLLDQSRLKRLWCCPANKRVIWNLTLLPTHRLQGGGTREGPGGVSKPVFTEQDNNPCPDNGRGVCEVEQAQGCMYLCELLGHYRTELGLLPSNTAPAGPHRSPPLPCLAHTSTHTYDVGETQLSLAAQEGRCQVIAAALLAPWRPGIFRPQDV